MLSKRVVDILSLLGLLLVVPCISKPFNDLEKRESVKSASENEFSANQIIDENNEARTEYAKQMLSYMNLTVDPCEDFYEYACGNWKNVIVEKQMKEKRSHLFESFSWTVNAMDEILTRSNINLGEDYDAEFELAQQFYHTCLKADVMTVKRTPEYLEVIQSIGGFPAVDDTWNPAKFSWFNMSAHLSNYGIQSLINEEIAALYPFLPCFNPPKLGFGFIIQSDTISSNSSKAYTTNERQMRKYLKAYGVNETKASEVVSEIFEFWRAVLNITDFYSNDPSICQNLNETSNTEELVRWDDYFDIAWMGKTLNYTSTIYSKSDYFPCDLMYRDLSKICDSHKYAVANYLALKFLHGMDAEIQSESDHREYCVRHVLDMGRYLLEQLYLRDYVPHDKHVEVASIINEVKNELRLIIEDAEWLDEETRAEALRKESLMTTIIGYPDNPQLIHKLIKEMNNITRDAENYEQNNINVHKFSAYMTRYLSLYSELFDNSTKPMRLNIATQINAFYNIWDNSIYIFEGILHPPAYDQSWPMSLKFGTLGYLIGHELTHAFDTDGSHFDSSGNERLWLSETIRKIFQERVECFVEHFSGYLIPEINRYIDGSLVKDENIADNGGLHEAYKAYRSYMKKASKTDKDWTPKDELMPGMDFSPEQLFFLGFGQLWCSSYREEHLWKELEDVHPIDKYRVLGAVRNSYEFAQAFECPLKSKSNPEEKKCMLW